MTEDLRGTTLVVATHNPGKSLQLRTMLAPYEVSVLSADDLGLPEPPETGSTFRENATIKARAARDATGLPVLADDSGLCVDALAGRPGVATADWAGTPRDYDMAMGRLRRELSEVHADDPSSWTSRFVSVLVLATPDGAEEVFEGVVEGMVVWPPRGTAGAGLGFDPVFVPEGHTRTLAEIPEEEKYGFSHRARAFDVFRRAAFPDGVREPA